MGQYTFFLISSKTPILCSLKLSLNSPLYYPWENKHLSGSSCRTSLCSLGK